MLRNSFFLVALVLSAPIFAASSAAPAAVDPMLWSPPAEAPAPRERLPLEAFTTEAEKLVASIEERRAEYAPLPDRAMIIYWVNKNSPAEKMGIRPGDFLIKVDGETVTRYEEFTALRKDAPQKVTLFTPGRGERELGIPQGKIGVSFASWNRPVPTAFRLPREPKWNAHLTRAELIFPRRMDLVETALFHAVKAGCPVDSRMQALLARVALNDQRYPDAMAHAWSAMKDPTDKEGAGVFLRAALADYKLQAALDALEKFDVLEAERSRIPDLRRLVAQHQALQPDQRVRLSPLAQAASLYQDPLLPRAKTVAGARDPAEPWLAWLEEWRWFPFDATTREMQNICFGPEVQGMRMAFDFSLRETNLDSDEKYLAAGVLDMELERRSAGTSVVDHLNRKWKVGNLPSVVGFIANQSAVLIRPGLTRIHTWTRGLCVELSESIGIDPDQRYSLELAVWNGQIEMALDGKRLYYAPLDSPDARLAVFLGCSGVTSRLREFSAAELIEPKDVAAKIKPVVNEKLRRGHVRLHGAGAYLPASAVSTLLELGADPNLSGLHGENPMHYTIKLRSDKKEKEVVAAMLARGGKMDLPLAAALADHAKIEALIKADPQCVKGALPWSPLLPAIWYNDIATVRLLLDKGVDVNAVSPGSESRTPLISAVLHKDKALFDLLLERGADVNLGDRNRNTALFFARDVKQPDMEAELVKRKALLKAEAPSAKPVKPPAPPTGDF